MIVKCTTCGMDTEKTISKKIVRCIDCKIKAMKDRHYRTYIYHPKNGNNRTSSS